MSFFSKKLYPVLTFGCLAIAPVSQASEIRGIAGVSIDFGGETLVTAIMSNGDERTIKSHEGMGIMGGIYSPFDDGYGLSATVGYKFATITASNGTMEFSRFPIEIMGSKQIGPHRLGAGIAHHTGMKYSCDVQGWCSDETKLDDASGLLFSYEFMMSQSGELSGKGMLVGARYTMLEYKNPDNSTVNASGFGLYLGGQF